MLRRHAVSGPGGLFLLASVACAAPGPVIPERAEAEFLSSAAPDDVLATAADVLRAEGYEVVGWERESIRLEKIERDLWESERRRWVLLLTMEVTARPSKEGTRITLVPGSLMGGRRVGGDLNLRYPVKLTRDLALDARRFAREIERTLAKRAVR